MNSLPFGYDEDVDVGAIEHLSLVECICRRPRMFTAEGRLSEILAVFDGYEMATNSAFGDSTPPPHYDISPCDTINALADLIQIERKGRSIHMEFDAILQHFGGEEAAIEGIRSLAEKIRKRRAQGQ